MYSAHIEGMLLTGVFHLHILETISINKNELAVIKPNTGIQIENTITPSGEGVFRLILISARFTSAKTINTR